MCEAAAASAAEIAARVSRSSAPPPPEGASTLTCAEALVVPPGPEQLSVKVVAVVMAALVSVPLVAFVPVQPPEAVQLVAFVLDQVRVTVPLLETCDTFVFSDTVGAGGAGATDRA